jgi:hypothetical protein
MMQKLETKTVACGTQRARELVFGDSEGVTPCLESESWEPAQSERRRYHTGSAA